MEAGCARPPCDWLMRGESHSAAVRTETATSVLVELGLISQFFGPSADTGAKEQAESPG